MPPDSPPRRPRRTALTAAAVALWLGLFAVGRVLAPDGREHGDWGQFFGRFHPLLIHLPIGILMLAIGTELAALRPRWAALRPLAGGLLGLAALLTYATAVDGWLLAWSGGYRGRVVDYHQWTGEWLAVMTGLAALVRRGRPGAAYAVLLAAAAALLVVASHFGGTLSHGEGYLTDKLPPALRAWFGRPPAPPAAVPAGETAATTAAPAKVGLKSADPANPAYYAVHIAPLFIRSCVPCHRPEKHKGDLRMDTLAELRKGGSDGPALVPGDPKNSEILRRVALPPSDDDFMPSDDEKPLTREEIQMITAWIAAGAKG
jgi:uncharacterized membrane protein/mono/diheme cytochrome c family protein